MPFSYKSIIIYFFIVPAILYAGYITHFSFNFFFYDRLWLAYNALAISIMNGALDVPFEAIGIESFYYNGKVYFYYGYFPVLLRLILAPLIDLNTVSLARISVWMMTTVGAASIQYALIYYTKPKNTTLQWDFIRKTKLIILSLVVWLGSAHFIIVQKGDIYHEPYAAMLLISSLFLVFVYRDIFWDFNNRRYRLVLYALLAALSVHTRQTIAISLYLAVFILIIMKVVDVVNINKTDDKKIFLKYFFHELIKIGYKPLLILLAGGSVILILNYLRFDDIFALSKGQSGSFRIGEGFSPRVCGAYITGADTFEIGRIIPNLIYYTIGGAYTHSRLIDYLGLGYVRIEYNFIQFIWLWSTQLIIFLFVLYQLIRGYFVDYSAKVIMSSLLMSAFIVSSLLILSYTTITVRYVADLWLPLGFSLLIFSRIWIFENKVRTNFLWYLIPISIFMNVAYGSYFHTEYNEGNAYSSAIGLPDEEVLNKLYNPVPRAGDIDEECKKYNYRVR